MTHARTAPEPTPCWEGAWDDVEPMTELWLLGAMNRTVATLPRLHPWRLGDGRGSGRLLQWTGTADQDLSQPAYGVLAVTARDPDLAAGDLPDEQPWGLGGDLASDWVAAASRGLWDTASGVIGSAVDSAVVGDRPRWAGVLTRLPDTWFPAMAILSRAEAGLDDPRSGWQTESVDFDDAHSVHSADTRFAADVLAPNVMAVVLDRVPRGAAITMAGDAIHLWWPYREPYVDDPARVARAADVVVAFAEAIPGFLLSDHPDRSAALETTLEERAQQAEQYRNDRHLGSSPDPVLQRIYDQARAGLDPA
ncbi:MAG: hypothetical protein WAN48_09970 [Actinomycetes bacterium]